MQRASDMDLLNPRNQDLTDSLDFLPVFSGRLGSISPKVQEYFLRQLLCILFGSINSPYQGY